ncbi:transglutaminase family protein [Rhodobacteraceae bacterium 2376]|uniref:Transglutaminase family protein n=1 Tax=Rhabdonatronobacter sediminivivens TaxID=2743469 RepID=A0A7Z0HXV3_9RHOB|nr:transglutaminase family protein [Rhabdonatronobacter sediminivivens]NYS24285.1 transglutaminase family protein [Rhabdonatronobacter sediminivivens]
MILTIAHETLYRYDHPMRGVVQTQRLTPARFDGQTVLDWSVEVSGCDGASVLWGGGFRDGAGDWVQGCTVVGPVSAVSVRVTGRIETNDLSGVLRGHRERIPPEAYLRHTPATAPDVALHELAQAAVAETQEPLARAHALAGAVQAAIAYRPGVTEAHTTAAESLALGEGVCQDHAHALIAAGLCVGIPGRYVSGYLQATEDGAPHEAAHAWAELFVPGLGWVGFDASNGVCPDDRYVRLGSGRDAREAAPIRGIARGPGAESLDVTVAVNIAQQ